MVGDIIKKKINKIKKLHDLLLGIFVVSLLQY